MTVHVVGNVCLDTTFRLARFPDPGETLNAEGCEVGLGGKGANQALAALRAGAPTRLWAPVGRDNEADAIRRRLAETSLDANDLAEVDAPTDRSTILVDRSAENLIVSAVAAARAFPAERAGWAREASRGDVLVLQNNLSLGATAACLQAARAAGLVTILNASPLGAEAPPPIDGVDLIVVNRGEGERLAGEADPDAIASQLISNGARAVLLSLGRDGALLGRGAERIRVAAPAVEAVDTSGAGDVLCGTLAGLLDRGILLPHAARAAVLAASCAVMRRGAFGCGPIAAEMADILKDLS